MKVSTYHDRFEGEEESERPLPLNRMQEVIVSRDNTKPPITYPTFRQRAYDFGRRNWPLALGGVITAGVIALGSILLPYYHDYRAKQEAEADKAEQIRIDERRDQAYGSLKDFLERGEITPEEFEAQVKKLDGEK